MPGRPFPGRHAPEPERTSGEPAGPRRRVPRSIAVPGLAALAITGALAAAGLALASTAFGAPHLKATALSSPSTHHWPATVPPATPPAAGSVPPAKTVRSASPPPPGSAGPAPVSGSPSPATPPGSSPHRAAAAPSPASAVQARPPATSPAPPSAPAPSQTPTPRPTAPAASPAPAPRSSPSPSPSGGCTPPDYSACGFPDASNTGVPAGTTLTPSGGMTITTNGTVINGADITGVIDVEASNVTIENSVINGTSWWAIRYGVSNPSVSGLQVIHDTIQASFGSGPDNGGYDYAILPQTSGSMTVAYDNISGFKDGIDTSSGTIHDNYIHDLSPCSGCHDQDIYVHGGGAGSTITHNTLIGSPTSAGVTAAVYIANDEPNQDNDTVEGNWMAGGAYCVYQGYPPTGSWAAPVNIKVLNNVFSTELYATGGMFGVNYGSGPGSTWSGNTWINGPNAGQPAD